MFWLRNKKIILLVCALNYKGLVVTGSFCTYRKTLVEGTKKPHLDETVLLVINNRLSLMAKKIIAIFNSNYLLKLSGTMLSANGRLAPVLKTIVHQCVISYTCSQSYSDGSVLKQSHQS